MDILAAYYQNIWPFAGDVVVRFASWNTVVKAPIGTWKSFLFFDGPLWALYKSTHRPLLHRQSAAGMIQLLIVLHASVYLIERSLTSTKAWNDSIRSRLFRVGEDASSVRTFLAQHCPEMVTPNATLKPVLEQCRLDEVHFSSQLEFEAQLRELLPPKEVTQNLYFLMQDQPSIFDVSPAERITIFKELFQLLWIDEGKEKIQQKKRELQAELKVMSDTSRLDTKFHQWINALQDMHHAIDQQLLEEPLLPDIRDIRDRWIKSPIWQDTQLLWDDIRVTPWSWTSEDLIFLEQLLPLVQEYRDMYVSTKTNIDKSRQQLTTLQRQHQDHQQTRQRLVEEINLLQKNISSSSASDEALASLRQQRQEYDAAEQRLVHDVDWDVAASYGCSHRDFLGYYEWIKEMISAAKEYKREYTLCQEKQEAYLSQHQQDKQRIADITQQLATLETSLQQQTMFHCDKIEGSCPYVELIKGRALDGLKKQQEQLGLELRNLEQQSTEREKQYRAADYATRWERLRNEIDRLSRLFRSLPRKDIDERYRTYTSLQWSRRALDEQQRELEQTTQHTQMWRDELTQKQTQLSTLDVEQQRLSDALDEVTHEIATLTDQIWSRDLAWYDNLLARLSTLRQTCMMLLELLDEYTQQKLRLKSLQEQEKMSSELFTIFSKELLLVVLQEFLPNLEEVMNAHLAQVVNWEVKFVLDSWSTLSLDILVTDKLGQRHVKSLSGGQKTILKLMRIMSVATMMDTSFLFLDETINNIDEETIGRVAAFLDDYVTSRNIAFVVITHAPQIQHMTMRDRVIDLPYIFAGVELSPAA